MHLLRFLTATLLAVAIPFPAIAQPHRIAELGTAPLIGEIQSTSQLQTNVARDGALFKAAGSKLGISNAEYAAFASRIASGQLTYVTIPRHLDAMSWASAGQVYVLHDVIVPRSTRGWEVDLVERDQTVALFVPARCGNLSIVRRPRPRIAAIPTPTHIAKRPAPMRLTIAMLSPTPAPQASAAPAPDASPDPTPTPASGLTALTTVAQAPQTHHNGWWPLLLLPVAFLFHGHGGTLTTPPAIGISAAPTPPPASCTTKIRR